MSFSIKSRRMNRRRTKGRNGNRKTMRKGASKRMRKSHYRGMRRHRYSSRNKRGGMISKHIDLNKLPTSDIKLGDGKILWFDDIDSKHKLNYNGIDSTVQAMTLQINDLGKYRILINTTLAFPVTESYPITELERATIEDVEDANIQAVKNTNIQAIEV
jgi:hypothetical protein